ncbi:MAG: hypothetical protein KOO63_14785, partial [Bacteroidales bacterium]|nr:hypothetical protein [Candidatus Latescibacterota bacterium]
MKTAEKIIGLAAMVVALSLVLYSCSSSDPLSSGEPDTTGNDTIPPNLADTSMIVDHTCCDITAIPRQAIQDAIDNLVIAYGHTSHGSQLVSGMDVLAAFLGDDLYNHSLNGSVNTLELRDKAMSYDLGYP